jgi:NAD(P)-dependent dehydrogenase (short-subunit alcohol dehydrogenase family)
MTTGQVVIVTGATSGIGEATVRLLAAQGASVAALARSDLASGDVEGTVASFRCDVRDESAVHATVGQVLNRFGRLDALVNAAGILRAARVGESRIAESRDQLDTNLLGTIAMVERCAEHLSASGGVIVNFSSTLAEHPAPGLSVYAASKGGIEAYTRSIALEMAPAGVRANCIRLGLVRTSIHRAAGRSEHEAEEIFESGAARLPLRRVGTPEEVAGVVGYLLSDQTTWITGSSLVVDGGRSIS